MTNPKVSNSTMSMAALMIISTILIGINSISIGNRNEDFPFIKSYKKIWDSGFVNQYFKESIGNVRTDNDTIDPLKSCACEGYTCGCCLHLDVERIELNETGCVNITYLPDEYGVELTLSLNGVVYIDKKVSARNPPPICAGIPKISKLASICLRLYNLSIARKRLSGCAKIQVILATEVIADFQIGCFRIPPRGGSSLPWISEEKLQSRSSGFSHLLTEKEFGKTLKQPIS